MGAEVSFLRPVEPGGAGQPSVYTFFMLRRTASGGLCGVAGHAVWTYGVRHATTWAKVLQQWREALRALPCPSI